MRFLIAFMLALISKPLLAGSGYQASVNGGLDNVRENEVRKAASFGQFKISTVGRLFRVHSSFTGLTGTEYMEGEVAMGLQLYLLTPFITKRAPVYPFLYAEGTFGVGTLDKKERMDAGYAYGAGVDLKFFDKSGLQLSMSLNEATEKTVRYQVGFFWIVSN